MTYRPRIQAGLTLTGQGVCPEDISATIPIAPTQMWRAGDIIGNSQLKRRQDGWAFSLPAKDTVDLEAVLCELLSAVETFKDDLDKAVARFGLEKEISCAVYIRGETPMCSMTADTIRRLASLGVDVDLDLIVSE